MTELNLGKGHDNTLTRLKLESYQGSNLVLNVGDRFDMSVLELEFIEHESSSIAREIARIRELAYSEAVEALPEPTRSVAKREATKVADTADKILAERKWYSVSAQGLMEATKAVGETASPLLGACLKVIELLGKATKP